MRYVDVSPNLRYVKRRLRAIGERETMHSTTASINPLLELANQVDKCIEAIDRRTERDKKRKKERNSGLSRNT